MTWLDLEGTANTRDLGGLPVSGGGTIAPGVLLRSDNLQDLTAADVRALQAIPLSYVLDLRTSVERAGTGPAPLDDVVDVVHLPLILEGDARASDPGAVLPDRWADGASGAYLHYLADAPGSIARAAALVASSTGASIVHCAAGKDRTGVLVAILLEAVGVPRDAVVADYALTNERIEQVYDRLVGSRTYADDVRRIGLDAHRVDPHAMETVLDVVDERWGGAAGYLQKAGFGDLDALRARLTA
jgi:protein tyrosine/serine phosphatase